MRRSLFILFIVVSQTMASRSLNGQEASPPDRIAEAIASLRDSDLDRTLRLLGEAVDANPSLGLTTGSGVEAAGGGLYRKLSLLPPDEQYELLHRWSMPTEQRPSIRLMTCLVPQASPPIEFARALGERPKSSTFTVASVGEFRGLFCSAWALVQAAKETGRMRRLITELEPLVASKTVNADAVLALAKLVDGRADETVWRDLLQQQLSVQEAILTEPSNANFQSFASLVALIAASTEQTALRPTSETMFARLIEVMRGKLPTNWTRFLRNGHAISVQLARGESSPTSLRDSRLKYWISTSGTTPELDAEGAVPTIWLTHEDHLLHVTGAGNDALYLRYPIVGDFDFRCELQSGGADKQQGGLTYGGLHFQVDANAKELYVRDASSKLIAKKPCPFARSFDQPTFHRESIQLSADEVALSIHLHPMWKENEASRISPWLGLRSQGERRSRFRNIKVLGTTSIPKQVALIGKADLRGWIGIGPLDAIAPVEGNTSLDPPASTASPTFKIQDGAVTASSRSESQGGSIESLIAYQRPMMIGESITYEYFFEPNTVMVHPALGRVAFLIEPDGVRLHWITTVNREWTGLASDNAVVEPLNRRGPKPIPLKPGAWNRVTMTRDGKELRLTLNDTLIYQRPVDWDGEHRFGFFRDETKSEMRVRNAVMSGDWPEKLPDDFIANPVCLKDASVSKADHYALHHLIGGETLADNTHEVCRRAASLKVDERFDYLSRWILPSDDHPDFRLTGDFTERNPVFARNDDESHEGGSKLLSPVFDWLDAAEGAHKLDSLLKSVEAFTTGDDLDAKRASLALKALIFQKKNDRSGVDLAVGELIDCLGNRDPKVQANLWPEMLVAYRTFRAEKDAPLAELLDTLSKVGQGKDSTMHLPSWHAHIAAMNGRQKAIELDAPASDISNKSIPAGWIATSTYRARTRGEGFPDASWESNQQAIHHVAGHHVDYLLFAQPMTDDFEITCDVLNPGINTLDLVAAGQSFGPRKNLGEFATGIFRDLAKNQTLEPPLGKYDSWVHMRAVCHDGSWTTSINGRVVRHEKLGDYSDPWVGLRSFALHHGTVRDLQINGQPKILQEVPMAASADLSGWIPYFEESIGNIGDDWSFEKDSSDAGVIVGKQSEVMQGSNCESYLRYQRPLMEDGSIEYEFFYEPGKTLTHPALDRLVFLLEPDTVRIHWLTDGPFNHTELAPNNNFDEPANRRGTGMLPLVKDAWNRLKLSARGQVVEVELNGKLIYHRELEVSNRRTFGLFHFSDQTEIRVRNCVMRGDWPKELDQKSARVFARNEIERIDAEVPNLKSVFTYDFRKKGLDPQFFQQVNKNGTAFGSTSKGLRCLISSGSNLANAKLGLAFSMHGDFDVVVAFEGLALTTANNPANVSLTIEIDDEAKHQVQTMRGNLAADRAVVRGQTSVPAPDGKRRMTPTALAHEATAGRLRLARRGDVVHSLFAEGDSTAFQLISSEKVSTDDIARGGIQLGALLQDLKGQISFVFTDLTVSADKLMYYPSATASKVLRVMKADGSEVRDLVTTPEAYKDMTSPEWSADGKKIAFSMRNTFVDSHIFKCDADGKNMLDLGTGCGPSFSPDGKQIAYCALGRGVLITDANVSLTKILIDPEGWNPAWSPDGKWIAYSKLGNVVLCDVATKRKHNLFAGDQADRFTYAYWDIGWSNDSRSIGLMARNRTTGLNEIVATDIDDPSRFEVLFAGPGVTNPDISWSVDNQRITLPMQLNGDAGPRLYSLSRGKNSTPQLLPGQPNAPINDCDWSPDGEHLIFTQPLSNEPIEWQASSSVSVSDGTTPKAD